MSTMRKYEQVMDQVVEMINSGILAVGSRIPSVRSMTQQSGYSQMTVLEGYKRLEEQGVIESRPQSGFYVRPPSRHRPAVWKSLREARTEPIAIRRQTVKISTEVEVMLRNAMRDDLIPFGAGLPDPSWLPSEELSLRMSRVVRSDPMGANHYSLLWGEPDLIHELECWMATYGCIPEKEETIVTEGCTQGLLIGLRAVCNPGDTVAVESPCYFGVHFLMQFLQLKSIEIPSDPQTGFNVDAFEKAIQKQRPKAVLLSSTYSNPTGALMPDDEKKRLLKIAKSKSIAVLEDDTYGDLHFGNERPHPLKYYDPDHVIYFGSFSKTLSPGYRVAWVSGGKYSTDILSCKTMGILSTPMSTQLAVAAYLKDGGMVRHLKRLRKTYAENVRFFQSAIARTFPDGTRTSDPAGGQFIWVEQPKGFDSVELSRRALKKEISIAPGVMFSARQNYRSYFRINCAMPWTEQIEQALATLGGLCDQLQKSK